MNRILTRTVALEALLPTVTFKIPRFFALLSHRFALLIEPHF
jgi:hypothetical protein